MAKIQEGRVTIVRDVIFGEGGGRPLRCDIYYPPKPRPRQRSVLLLHGGAWMQGDRSQLQGYGVLLARTGLVCVASEYRLIGEARWPAQIHDCKAALRFMRASHADLGIDPDRVAVQGNSAGGHLALLLAGTQNLAELEGDGGHAGAGTQCAACLAIYPPTQLLGQHRTSSMIRALFPADTPDEIVAQASPITHARKDFPPTLLVHGNRDTLVPCDASLSMYKALSETGADVELHMFNKALHAFDAERALGRQVADLMLLFLDRHVPEAP